MEQKSLSQQMLIHGGVWFLVACLFPLFSLLFQGGGLAVLPSAFLSVVLSSPFVIPPLGGALLVMKLVHSGTSEKVAYWDLLTFLLKGEKKGGKKTLAFIAQCGPLVVMSGLVSAIAVGWMGWCWGVVHALMALATGSGAAAVSQSLELFAKSITPFVWGLGVAFVIFLPLYFRARLLKVELESQAVELPHVPEA